MTEPERQARPRLHEATLLLRRLILAGANLERLHARRLDVNDTAYRVMGVLLSHGPTSPGSISAELGMTPSATSNVIDRLITVGHAERRRDPSDGRRMVISALPESREVAMAGIWPLVERAEALLVALPPEQQQAVTTYLAGVLESLASLAVTLEENHDAH